MSVSIPILSVICPFPLLNWGRVGALIWTQRAAVLSLNLPNPRTPLLLTPLFCPPSSLPSLLQNWDDEDVVALLEWMEDQLAEGIMTLSSFERYRKELLAGTLTWSPLHEQVQAVCSMYICCRLHCPHC